MAGALSAPGLNMPDWASNPASADLEGMAGTMTGAATYTPSDDALVASQLGKLLSKDSDYMTRARTRAMQTANSRGLLNSSIAAGAGESAAIDAALPIAQQDATSHLTAQRDNTSAINSFAADSNAFKRQGALSKLDAGTRLYSQGLDLAQQDKQLQADTAYRTADLDLRRGALASDDAFRRQQLASTEANQGATLALEGRRLDAQVADQQANRSLEKDRLAQQARSSLAGDVAQMRQQATQAQAALESDPNMSQEAKASAITALSRKVSADVQEVIRFSGVDLPQAWPDWVNQVGTAAPTPAAGTTTVARGRRADPNDIDLSNPGGN